jgi:adenylate cyclase
LKAHNSISNQCRTPVKLPAVNLQSIFPSGVIGRRLLAGFLIALGAWLIALIATAVPILNLPFKLADNVFYDAFYHLRPIEDQTNGPVVIVAIDQRSLDAVDKSFKYGWPWPRDTWALMTAYLGKCGVKAVAIDLVFTERSVYANTYDDDATFAKAIDESKVPWVLGSRVNPDGSWERFAPPVSRPPTFGAVNVGNDKTYRQYLPQVNGKPSLAVATAAASGQTMRGPADRPFLLHYYGPYKSAGGKGKTTFNYISAGDVLGAATATDATAKAIGLTPDMFRGKIVVIGPITVGLNDLKSSPLSDEYPGVEVQATAMVNLLNGQEVMSVPLPVQDAAGLIAASIAAFGIVFPRRASLKMLGPLLAVAVILVAGVHGFVQPDIRWLSPTAPLLAIAIATVGAFSWTYFAEDRQRKFMLKALSKVVSPAVAEQLSRDPQKLALGTVRLPITLLFTDMAGFTAMSEAMDVQKLGKLLNRYLGEMSDQVLANQGTLDKYIGDGIMCFWNAPLPQVDHAARACRAALGIASRENEIRAELQSLGAPHVYTRIGINTTIAAVGFVGSSSLFNYTALGDGVNLASRLEGANKLYGSKILLAQSTADLVEDQFILRKLDLLAVKGKLQPIWVYQLLSERVAEKNEPIEYLVAAYESALADFQKQNWNLAQKQLLELLSRFADDEPSKALLRRIADLRENPPPADWNGVYTAKEK